MGWLTEGAAYMTAEAAQSLETKHSMFMTSAAITGWGIESWSCFWTQVFSLVMLLSRNMDLLERLF